MTKEHVIKLREMFKGYPIQVTADNQRLYYGGAKDKNVLLWDDDENLLYTIRVSIEQRNQDLCPIEIATIEYDTIQEIIVYPDKKEFMKYLKDIKSKLSGEEYGYALNMVTSAFNNRYSNKTPAGGKYLKAE